MPQPPVPASWDSRVVPPGLVDFVRAVQNESACRLAGGSVLSGAHLRHRLSHDIDLFCDTREDVRQVLASCIEQSEKLGGQINLVRDGGAFVRAKLSIPEHNVLLDIAYEPSTPLAPRETVEGVVVDSLADLSANKITCLLSRAEPRDLVDLCFLDRAQKRPEDLLQDALTKDAGVDPGILSYLLKSFPLTPLPIMLEPFDEQKLREFRDELSARFRAIVVPHGS